MTRHEFHNLKFGQRVKKLDEYYRVIDTDKTTLKVLIRTGIEKEQWVIMMSWKLVQDY